MTQTSKYDFEVIVLYIWFSSIFTGFQKSFKLSHVYLYLIDKASTSWREARFHSNKVHSLSLFAVYFHFISFHVYRFLRTTLSTTYNFISGKVISLFGRNCGIGCSSVVFKKNKNKKRYGKIRDRNKVYGNFFNLILNIGLVQHSKISGMVQCSKRL